MSCFEIIMQFSQNILYTSMGMGCIYVDMYKYNTYTYICIYTRTIFHIYTQWYTYKYIYIERDIYIYIHIHITYTYTYTYIYIYIYIYKIPFTVSISGQPGRPRWLRPAGAPLRRRVGLRALQPGHGCGGRGPGDPELPRRLQRGHPGCLGSTVGDMKRWKMHGILK